MKKLSLLLLTLFLANCQLSGGDTVSLNLDSATQAGYLAEWKDNVKSIDVDNLYHGNFDWYGGGAYVSSMYFDASTGNMLSYWESSCWNGTFYPADGYAQYNLMNVEDNDITNDWKYNTPLFVNGNTAIVYLPYSATSSPGMAGTLYVLQVKNGKLYRTKSADGFDHINTWDGVTVSLSAIAEIPIGDAPPKGPSSADDC